MNIQDIQKRYNMPAGKAKAFIATNLDHINADGEHAKNVKRVWTVDDEGIRIMDALLGYVPPAPGKTKDEAKAPAASVAMQQEIARLTTQNQDLMQALGDAKTANEQLQQDLDQLQNQFLSVQEGRDSMNSAMIRKYQAIAEKAQNESRLLKQRLETVRAAKEDQYTEQQARIDDLTHQLAAQNDILKEKLEANYKLVEAKKLEERLYSELNGSKQERDDLIHHLESSQTEQAAAIKQVADIRQQIVQSLETLRSVESQLEAAVKSNSETDVVKDDVQAVKPKQAEPKAETVAPAGASVKPQAMPKAPAGVVAAPALPVPPAIQQQMDESADPEKAVPKVERGIFHRVACFLGF